MGTRTALQLVSVLLKICAVLILLVMVIGNTASNLSVYLRDSSSWLQAINRIVDSVLMGVLAMLFAYGGAKVIDLLLGIESDIHAVAQVVAQSKRRREAAQDNLAPDAPDPNRHVWTDHPGSIRDGRNLQQPVYDVWGQRIYRGKPKR